MKISFVRCSMAALLGAAMLVNAGSIKAAPVSWGSVFEVITDADVDTTGTIVSAVNGGPAGAADFTATVNSKSITFVSPDPSIFPSAHQFGSGSGLVSTGNTEIDFMLDGHTWSGGDSSGAPVPFTVAGLASGMSYQIQLFAAGDGRGGSAGREQSIHDTADGSGNNSAPMLRSSDVGGTGGSHGNSVIGTFTADAATQDLWISGVRDAGLSGYIVSTVVPEPSTCLLLGFAIISGLGMGRRRS